MMLLIELKIAIGVALGMWAFYSILRPLTQWVYEKYKNYKYKFNKYLRRFK